MPPVTWIFHKCFINSGPNFCLIRIHFMVYQKMLCSKCHRRLPTGLYTINHIYILTSTLSTRGGCHNTYQYIDRYTFLKLSYKNNSNNWLLCYQWICKALRKKQIKSTQYGDIYKKSLNCTAVTDNSSWLCLIYEFEWRWRKRYGHGSHVRLYSANVDLSPWVLCHVLGKLPVAQKKKITKHEKMKSSRAVPIGIHRWT